MTDMISLRLMKQLLLLKGFTANIFGHRVKVFTDELGWIAVETFIANSIFGARELDDSIIDDYALLIADYLANGGTYREDRIEELEADYPDVVDAYYQRELALAGANHKHGI